MSDNLYVNTQRLDSNTIAYSLHKAISIVIYRRWNLVTSDLCIEPYLLNKRGSTTLPGAQNSDEPVYTLTQDDYLSDHEEIQNSLESV